MPLTLSEVDWTYLKEISRNWQAVIWHHSATPGGHAYDWDAIKRYHTQEKGWSDIGYHFGIDKVDGHAKIYMGRPLSMAGAHCKGWNEMALGVCVVGDYDKNDLPDDTFNLVVALGKKLLEVFPDIRVSTNHYHREFADKTCPGLKFPSLAVLRTKLEAP